MHNEDRHLTKLGGNPNLLWDMQCGQLAVIDHNQAFDRDFNAAHFLDSHVFADYWNRAFGDHVERSRYQTKMKAGAFESVGRVSASVRPEPVEGLAETGACGSTSSPRTANSPQFRLHPMKALLSRLNDIRVNIPGSWWHFADGVPADVTWDEIVACLERCHREDFWKTP